MPLQIVLSNVATSPISFFIFFLTLRFHQTWTILLLYIFWKSSTTCCRRSPVNFCLINYIVDLVSVSLGSPYRLQTCATVLKSRHPTLLLTIFFVKILTIYGLDDPVRLVQVHTYALENSRRYLSGSWNFLVRCLRHLHTPRFYQLLSNNASKRLRWCSSTLPTVKDEVYPEMPPDV